MNCITYTITFILFDLHSFTNLLFPPYYHKHCSMPFLSVYSISFYPVYISPPLPEPLNYMYLTSFSCIHIISHSLIPSLIYIPCTVYFVVWRFSYSNIMFGIVCSVLVIGTIICSLFLSLLFLMDFDMHVIELCLFLALLYVIYQL